MKPQAIKQQSFKCKDFVKRSQIIGFTPSADIKWTENYFTHNVVEKAKKKETNSLVHAATRMSAEGESQLHDYGLAKKL